MVVLSPPPVLDTSTYLKTCKPASDIFTGIPMVDLSARNCESRIVQACQEFGFFKVVNHGVPMELLTQLESEAVKFFGLPQQEKDRPGPPNPFGYGNRMIGPNGDMGWLEYLLFCTNPQLIAENAGDKVTTLPQTLRCLVDEYVAAMKIMVCEVLEMIVEGLGIQPRDALSQFVKNKRSDSCFRLNHYPPCPELHALLSGRNVIGFGEHTDPQIISVIRSNGTSGLQVCLHDGSWVSVPDDHTSFYFIVGDLLQVMTNGKFKSVKHRVMVDSLKSRVSMVYFAGPPLNDKIEPLKTLMKDSEGSLYKKFTWSEYKKSAYKTKLDDNRLTLFQK